MTTKTYDDANNADQQTMSEDVVCVGYPLSEAFDACQFFFFFVAIASKDATLEASILYEAYVGPWLS